MKQRQKGFTLIEIVVALGITGAILAAVAITTTTLMMNSGQPSRQHTLLQQAQNAGYWIPRDINMASVVTPSGANGFPITLNIPVDQDENHDYTVDYLFYGDNLKRKQYDSSHNLTAETLIAQYVDSDHTAFVSVEVDLYKLTIRTSIGEEVVTMSYEAHQRLKLD